MKTDIYDSLVEQIEKVEDPDLKKNYMGVLTLIPKKEWEHSLRLECRNIQNGAC